MDEKKLISVIVPCYNEEEVLPLFYKEITKISAQMQEQHPELSFEYLFIDDGSKDRTLSKLRIMAKYDSRVRYVSFSRNFGKESAMYAGLKESKGDYCVIMDADLQHPPAFLPKMYETVASGYYDCATTRRVSREGESKVRSWFARRFYGIMNKISQTEIVDGAQDFRFMTRQMVDAVLSMTEYNRFSKGIFSWVGFRTKYLEYKNVERAAGKSSWSFWGLFRYSIEGIIGFSTAPLSASAIIGVVMCLLGLIMLIVTVIKKIAVGEPVAGYPTMICTILLFGGLQLFCTGIVGLYLGKTFLEVKRRPIYIIRETEKNADQFPELPEPEEKPAEKPAQKAVGAQAGKPAAPAKQAQKQPVRAEVKRVQPEKDAALEKARQLKEETDAEFDALVDAAFEEADAKKAAADAEKKAAAEAAKKAAEEAEQKAAEEAAQKAADTAEPEQKPEKEKFVVEINYDNDDLYEDLEDEEEDYDDEDYDDEDYDDEDYDDEDYDDEDYDDEDYDDEDYDDEDYDDEDYDDEDYDDEDYDDEDYDDAPAKPVTRKAAPADDDESGQPTFGDKAKAVLKSIGGKLKALKDKIAAAFADNNAEKALPDDEYDDDDYDDEDYDDYDDDDYEDDGYDDDDYDYDDEDDDDYDDDDYDDDDYDDDDYDDDDFDDDYDDDDFDDDDFDDDDYDDRGGKSGYRSAH
ncbi:MAG: glycosyltransferase family 2 protein [Oscillospiraceae bacterium]|nr:glycosyltransferase family 2 protein [Oscillospiraceae bacterium]